MNYEKKQLNYDRAKDKALRLLEFRSHSEKELKYKLLRAGAAENDIENILEFCREYKFVDDLEYAKRLSRDLKNLKRYGKRRIEQELYSKGISREYIALALENIDFDDEKETLCLLVKKKLAGNFDKKNTDRAIRYFVYRGYEINDIKNCIERIKGDADGV